MKPLRDKLGRFAQRLPSGDWWLWIPLFLIGCMVAALLVSEFWRSLMELRPIKGFREAWGCLVCGGIVGLLAVATVLCWVL